jgi:hypothetical protein
MRIARAWLIVAVLAAVLAGTNVAHAATVRVTGTITETSPGTCGEPVVTGIMVTLQCEGLVETWAGGISGTGVFDEERTLNFGSGQLLIRGTETFFGCVGVNCGTLESTFQGSGKLDLQTSVFR